MTTLVPFRDEWVSPYLAAAITAACGRAALSPREEGEQIRQVIALCEAQAHVAPAYRLPPEGAPIRAAVAEAVEQMRASWYRHDRIGSVEEAIHRNNMWNTTRQHAEQRLAALDQRSAKA